MAYKEPTRRTVRLDDDIWEAIKKMPLSLNQYLRKSLSAGGAFEPEQVEQPQPRPLSEVLPERFAHREAQRRAAVVERAPRDTIRKPLLKPKERNG